MAKAFVSYSRKDIEFAKHLTGELQKSEMDFWIDWEGIPPTVDWWKEIQKGIEEADVFLFLMSPDSAKSEVCGQEIETAIKNGKRLIPLVVREIAWSDTPPHLEHLNYIFFHGASITQKPPTNNVERFLSFLMFDAEPEIRKFGVKWFGSLF